MTRTTAIAWALLASCAASPLAAQATRTYKARLAPVPMTTAMASTVAGLGSVTAMLAGNKLTVTGTFDGLKSPATIAQVHRGQRGVRGPVVLDLKVANSASSANGAAGTISGTLDLTAQQVADLEKGWLYIQLHSEKAPDGNLWGWLMAQENRR
jgi:hypothetical protein